MKMSRIFFKTSCREWRICGTMNTEQRSFLYRNVERSNAHGNKSEYETQGQGACGSPQGRIPAQRWQVRFPLDFPGWQATFYLCRDLGGASGKGNDIQRDSLEGIKAEARYVTLNDVFTLWAKVKRGLKDNTFQNYLYLYRQFVEPDFGKSKVSALKKSDVKQFYNTLADERGLQISTIDSVHTVLHQVLDMAVDDCYLRSNPSDNVLRELKKSHQFETNRRKALTVAEQNLLLSYLSKTPKYQHWYPIFAVMLGTGLRVGEATGLRWRDVDFEEGTISVNHTLVNYDHRENNGGKKGCYFNCHSPKTKAGVRTVPMMDFVKEAFEKERAYQEEAEICCTVTVDGYTDFIFVNRFGECQHQGTLNKAIRRIIRDCNDEVLAKNPNSTVLLPRFSCHTLRHTFTTRMCEAGVNIKVIQDALGHSDISTTLNIYADVTKELRKSEFENLDRQFAQWKDPEE